MTEHCTGLPTPFRGSASDTPTRLLRYLSCAKARPAISVAPGNCRKVQQWTKDLAARLEAHARGTGGRLVEVITKAGPGFTLARTWPGTTRDREDLIKHAGGGRRYCPECGVTPSQGPAVVMPERRRSLDELERDGTWLDGSPLPDQAPGGRCGRSRTPSRNWKPDDRTLTHASHHESQRRTA